MQRETQQDQTKPTQAAVDIRRPEIRKEMSAPKYTKKDKSGTGGGAGLAVTGGMLDNLSDLGARLEQGLAEVAAGMAAAAAAGARRARGTSLLSGLTGKVTGSAAVATATPGIGGVSRRPGRPPSTSAKAKQVQLALQAERLGLDDDNFFMGEEIIGSAGASALGSVGAAGSAIDAGGAIFWQTPLEAEAEQLQAVRYELEMVRNIMTQVVKREKISRSVCYAIRDLELARQQDPDAALAAMTALYGVISPETVPPHIGQSALDDANAWWQDRQLQLQQTAALAQQQLQQLPGLHLGGTSSPWQPVSAASSGGAGGEATYSLSGDGTGVAMPSASGGGKKKGGSSTAASGVVGGAGGAGGKRKREQVATAGSKELALDQFMTNAGLNKLMPGSEMLPLVAPPPPTIQVAPPPPPHKGQPKKKQKTGGAHAQQQQGTLRAGALGDLQMAGPGAPAPLQPGAGGYLPLDLSLDMSAFTTAGFTSLTVGQAPPGGLAPPPPALQSMSGGSNVRNAKRQKKAPPPPATAQSAFASPSAQQSSPDFSDLMMQQGAAAAPMTGGGPRLPPLASPMQGGHPGQMLAPPPPMPPPAGAQPTAPPPPITKGARAPRAKASAKGAAAAVATSQPPPLMIPSPGLLSLPNMQLPQGLDLSSLPTLSTPSATSPALQSGAAGLSANRGGRGGAGGARVRQPTAKAMQAAAHASTQPTSPRRRAPSLPSAPTPSLHVSSIPTPPAMNMSTEEDLALAELLNDDTFDEEIMRATSDANLLIQQMHALEGGGYGGQDVGHEFQGYANP